MPKYHGPLLATMSRTRLPIAGLVLVAAGFAWWAQVSASDAAYLGMNLVRVASALLMIVGIVLMARGGSPMAFRVGVFGFLAAALVAFVKNVTGAIQLPEDLSTLFGFVGACAAAYGAAHWFEPEGDGLAAWWVAVGFGLMACNPGMYVLVGFTSGDPWRGGFMPGSVIAMVGAFIFAATAGRLALPVTRTRRTARHASSSDLS